MSRQQKPATRATDLEVLGAEVMRLRARMTQLETQILLLAGMGEASRETLEAGIRLLASMAGDGLKTP